MINEAMIIIEIKKQKKNSWKFQVDDLNLRKISNKAQTVMKVI